MIKDALKFAIPGYGLAATIAEQYIDSNKNSREILKTNDEQKIQL